MGQTKTDNSYLPDKAALRANHLPDGDVRVIDCYGGKGLVWAAVARLSGRRISRLPIDIKNDVGFALAGDNIQFLNTIDLNRFNCVDLDAYGVPAEQLKILSARQYTGWVYVTFIQTLYGMIPYSVYETCGVTKEMVKKSPTLFSRRGWEWFREFLARLGVERIYHRSASRKHYMAFRMGQ